MELCKTVIVYLTRVCNIIVIKSSILHIQSTLETATLYCVHMVVGYDTRPQALVM